MTFNASIRLLCVSLLVGVAGGGCGSSDASNPSNEALEGGSGTTACNSNGIAEGSEECDGQDFRGANCATKTMGSMSNGTLSCSLCHLVVQGCTSSSGAGGTSSAGGRPGGVSGSSGLGGGVGTGGG